MRSIIFIRKYTIQKLKNSILALAGMALLVGASSCGPKYCRFDAQAGAYQGCGFNQPSGSIQKDNQLILLFLVYGLSLSLSLSFTLPTPSFLSKSNGKISSGDDKNKYILKSIKHTHMWKLFNPES